MSEYIEKLEAALIDVLDFNHEWYEIKEHTGLSEDRCREIAALYKEVNENYNRRHGI